MLSEHKSAWTEARGSLTLEHSLSPSNSDTSGFGAGVDLSSATIISRRAKELEVFCLSSLF